MGPTGDAGSADEGRDGAARDGHLLVASVEAGSTDEPEVTAAAEVLGAELAACGHPDDLERALDRLDGRTLVIAGGDGSLHLAVTKLHLRGELARTRIGLVPLGTGNDLARALDLPLDAAEAARVVRDGRARPMDLIVDDAGGIVVNAVHVGIGAEAAEHAGRLKPRLGSAAYPLGAIRAGLRAPGWRLRVEVDGRVLSDSHRPTLMVGIGNGRGVGGGTALLPLAEPDDGLLDVVVSKATGPFARARFGAALASGQHLQDRDVRFARGRTVTLSGDPVGVNADGETGAEVRRRTWTVQAGAWSLVRP
jgi:diacylglycerol kinase family enzyme